MTRAAWLSAVVIASALALVAPQAQAADDDTARARSHYEMGVKLFDSREHEQALIEFSKANEIKSRPAAIFMMAQCEYLLGKLKEARGHYQAYITAVPDGEFVELARDRVQSIDKRQSTFAINSVPDEVMVRISPEGETGNVIATGQAPNNFSVPRGRYRIDVTKVNHQGQTRIVEIDIAETKPLFFKLDPIPARLEIETVPPGATLYVNGNRARNPYRQDVAPGHVEIFAEATDYVSKTIELQLAAGERKLLTGDAKLRLPYQQRSGRADLLIASGIIGGLVGTGAVAAAISAELDDPDVAMVAFLTGGALVGAVAGVVAATPLVPRYIPDNRALFIIGGIWIGAAEGFAIGTVASQVNTRLSDNVLPCLEPCRGEIGTQLRAGFIGSLPGLALGLTTGALFNHKAPTYGRVGLIQSAALGGGIFGAILQAATQWKPYGSAGWEVSVHTYGPTQTVPMGPGFLDCTDPDPDNMNRRKCAYAERSVLDLAPGALIGFNVGLAAGLLAAYLPDQSKYGPTWKRVLLVDLATGAGALAAGMAGCIAIENCLTARPTDDSRSTAAWAAFGGGVLGAVGGILMTRRLDDDSPAAAAHSASTMPVATIMPMRDVSGAMAPAFAAMGFF